MMINCREDKQYKESNCTNWNEQCRQDINRVMHLTFSFPWITVIIYVFFIFIYVSSSQRVLDPWKLFSIQQLNGLLFTFCNWKKIRFFWVHWTMNNRKQNLNTGIQHWSSGFYTSAGRLKFLNQPVLPKALRMMTYSPSCPMRFSFALLSDGINSIN